MIIHGYVMLIFTLDLSACASEWKIWNERLYYFSDDDDKRNVNSAEGKCERLEATLLKMNGDTEQEYIADEISKKHLLGIKRDGNKWEWHDGDEVGWSNWESEPPLINDGVNYVFMKANGEWKREEHESELPFICEKRDPCREQNSPTCQNGGTCNNIEGDYDCSCTPEWTGRNCENDFDECRSSPCQHDGTCVNHYGRFQCQCPDNWEGETCQTDINECEDGNPCQNGGSCENTEGSFQCECIAGWTGALCDIDIDECASTPCQNNGTCSDHLNRFSCQCGDGWIGITCERDVYECEDSPCHNSAMCINRPGSFNCNCSMGWEGEICDTDIDECNATLISQYCPFGDCENYPGSYNCTCDAGFGADCKPQGKQGKKDGSEETNEVLQNVFYFTVSFMCLTGVIAAVLFAVYMGQELAMRKGNRSNTSQANVPSSIEEPSTSQDNLVEGIETGETDLKSSDAMETSESKEPVDLNDVALDISAMYAKPMKKAK